MDNTNLKEALVILLFVFSIPNEIQASYDFRLAIAMDSTKMTTRQEFKDQKTLVKKVLTEVMKSKTIEYAIAVYTADTKKIFKDFDNNTTINMNNAYYLETGIYGFDPTMLFDVTFNARPDCLWFIRNSDNYTHPECNWTYAPMGYKVPVTKIALRYGREHLQYLRKITNLTDLLYSGLRVNKSIYIKMNFDNIVHSILSNCKKYQPLPKTIIPSAVLTPSPSVISSLHKSEIRMSSPMTSLTHSSAFAEIPYYSTESIVASTTTQSLLGQKSSPIFSSLTPTTSVKTSGHRSADKLRQEYEELLNYDVKQVNLSNDADFLTFVNSSSKLLKNIPALDAGLEINNVSYGWSISVLLERFCIGIAEAMINKGMAGKSLEAYTDNLVIRISLVDITNFSGYEFGDAGVEKGTIKIPLEVFKNESAIGAIVVMILDPVKPFIDGKLIDQNSNTTVAGKIIMIDVLPRPSYPLERAVTLRVYTKNEMVIVRTLDAVKYHLEVRVARVESYIHSVGALALNFSLAPSFFLCSGWSTAGCSVTRTHGNLTECQCNHMTHYAVLMSLDDQVIPKKHHQVMTIITYIGCSLSIMGVFLTTITFLSLPVLKSERTRIHCNLCLAIGSAQTLFLAAGTEELTQNTVACKLYAAAMLYFFISVFTWMLVEGIHLYQMVIIAFVSSGPMMKFYYALGWGFPAVTVIVTTAIAYKDYGTPNFCWISLRGGTIWAFTGPAACIILANMFVLVSVLRIRVKLDISNEMRQVAKTGARVSIVLLPLLGMTWIFGFLSVLPGFGIVFQYLFAITNSLQGLMVFVFHCVGNSEVRKEFFRKTAQWNLRKSFSSTTNTVTTNKVEPISMESYDANHKKA